MALIAAVVQLHTHSRASSGSQWVRRPAQSIDGRSLEMGREGRQLSLRFKKNTNRDANAFTKTSNISLRWQFYGLAQRRNDVSIENPFNVAKCDQ